MTINAGLCGCGEKALYTHQCFLPVPRTDGYCQVCNDETIENPDTTAKYEARCKVVGLKSRIIPEWLAHCLDRYKMTQETYDALVEQHVPMWQAIYAKTEQT